MEKTPPVISFISTANDLENPLHFDEKLLN